jgi:SAM-dependent methyltransferase
MATLLESGNRPRAGAGQEALAAWLAPRLDYAGKIHAMERQRETELMDDYAQARAYAEADFEDPHSDFIANFRHDFGNGEMRGHVLDLGCGPGDITLRFARAYPGCVVHGLDGSEPMLRFGRERLLRSPELAKRVELFQGMVPGPDLPLERYDIIISNSLLHHLPRGPLLWEEVQRLGRPGAPVFIMDLRRPSSREHARRLVDRYTGNEPEILRRDFYNSLLASFRAPELKKQLDRAGLAGFRVRETDDRHITVSGRLP